MKTAIDRYLFRGKHRDNGEWVTGYYVYEQYGTHGLCRDGHLIFSSIQDYFNPPELEHNYINPSTIGQCTGLKDKNGKLIFEGDIVEYWCPIPCGESQKVILTIKWEDDLGGFFGCLDDGRGWSIKNHNDFKIIGKIHDNSEFVVKDGR